MDILFLAPSLPFPPASGGTLRTHGMMLGLKDLGHTITLLCFHDEIYRPDTDAANVTLHTVPFPAERSASHRLRDLLLTRRPDIARRLYSRTYEASLRALLERHHFDLIQVEGIEMVNYLPMVKAIQPDTPVVFDAHNAEYDLQHKIYRIERRDPKRWVAAAYSFVQVGRIRRYERYIVNKADAVVAVSNEDATLLKPLRHDDRIFVVSNGIWVDHYEDGHESPFETGKYNLVYSGKMDYRPNVDAVLWFAHDILPHIPEAHLTVVGQKPHHRLESLRAMPNVTLTGFVPSVVPYLQHADVYVAPLRMGSGTRLKLLEAAASRRAIVATSIAAAGLTTPVLESINVEDKAKDFAEAIKQLLESPEKRQQMGENARERVRAYYDWSVLMPHLLTAYRHIGLEV